MNPQPQNKAKRLIIAGVILWLLVIFVAIFVELHNRNSTQPPSAAINTVTKYLKARENNIGADQSSPTAWLAVVKPLVTKAWFAQLQPPPNPQASTITNDYRIAHEDNYIIQSSITGCRWEDKNGVEASSSKGNIYCTLTDTTLSRATERVVPASSLQYGWVHSGLQETPVLELVKQKNAWLINSDATGEGQ